MFPNINKVLKNVGNTYFEVKNAVVSGVLSANQFKRIYFQISEGASPL